jgi:AcrR family transcriptional regulator
MLDGTTPPAAAPGSAPLGSANPAEATPDDASAAGGASVIGGEEASGGNSGGLQTISTGGVEAPSGGTVAITARSGNEGPLPDECDGEVPAHATIPAARLGEPAGPERARETTAPGRGTGTGSRVPAQGSARPAGRAGQAGARQERREQTRTALLSAAERLWAERGIHGASLDDIAAAAGLTKGAVYSNFAGKTDLLLALLERFTSDRIGTDVCDELQSADQVRDDAGRTGRKAKRDGSNDRARRLALLLVEFWLYGMRDYAAGWRIADWYAERRAHMAKELRDVDGIAPAERATLAMALDFGLAFQHLLDPDRVPADLYSTGIGLMLGHATS